LTLVSLACCGAEWQFAQGVPEERNGLYAGNGARRLSVCFGGVGDCGDSNEEDVREKARGGSGSASHEGGD
jgi:hypothetical protein